MSMLPCPFFLPLELPLQLSSVQGTMYTETVTCLPPARGLATTMEPNRLLCKGLAIGSHLRICGNPNGKPINCVLDTRITFKIGILGASIAPHIQASEIAGIQLYVPQVLSLPEGFSTGHCTRRCICSEHYECLCQRHVCTTEAH